MAIIFLTGLPYLLMKGAYCDSFVLHDDSEKSQLKEDVLPDHIISDKRPVKSLEVDPRKDLDDKWTKFYKFQPMWHIRNYFGEKIAFYFAWTGMLVTTLWIPMLFGLGVFLYGLYERSVTVLIFVYIHLTYNIIIFVLLSCKNNAVLCACVFLIYHNHSSATLKFSNLILK